MPPLIVGEVEGACLVGDRSGRIVIVHFRFEYGCSGMRCRVILGDSASAGCVTQRAVHGRIPGVGPAGGCGRNSNRVVMQRPNG